MKLYSTLDILEQAPPLPEFLVEPILPKVGLSIIAGAPASGKSTLVRGLAMELASMRDSKLRSWLGLNIPGKVSGAKVLLCHLEEPKSEVFRHLVDLGLTGDMDVAVLDMQDVTEPSFALGAVMEEYKPGFVVIDTMGEFLQIKEVNSYGETVAKLQDMRAISEQYGCHVMMTHHAPKQATSDENALLGSTGIRASIDTALVYRKLPRTGTRVLSCSKIRTGKEIEPLAVGIDELTRQSKKLGSALEAVARENCRLFAEIIQAEGRMLSKNDLREATGLTIKDVWDAVRLNPDNLLERHATSTSVKYGVASQEDQERENGMVPF